MSSFEPPGNAVKMESVVAGAPGYCTFLVSGAGLISLTFNTKIHDMISANCAIIDDYIPSPEGYGVPLLDYESFLLGRGCMMIGFGY